MPLFNRTVLVKIGTAGSLEGIGIEGLRIVFNVKKSMKGNTCNVDIYNLSESTRNKINEIDDIIVIEAGYVDEDVEKVIFIGDISRITKERDGPNIITKIEANDGEKTLREKKISTSYASGISANEILKDLMNNLGLPKKISNRLLSKLNLKSKQFANGFAFAGQTKDVIDKIINKLGYEWSVQNGEIKVVEKDEVDDSEVVLLSPTTGLVGSPKRRDDIENAANKDKKKTGWDVTALLQPTVEPTGRISIESELIENKETIFRIETVQHKGDTFGNEFNSIITVSDIL